MIEEVFKVYKDTTYRKDGYKSKSGSKWEVSNLGNVKRDGIIYKCPLKNTYYVFANVAVHRAVAELFINNPLNKPVVDHIDGNKLNNKVDNLRWATYSENARNPNTYYHMCGENNPMFGRKHTSDSILKMKDSWDEQRLLNMHNKMLGKNKGKHREWNEQHTKYHMI